MGKPNLNKKKKDCNGIENTRDAGANLGLRRRSMGRSPGSLSTRKYRYAGKGGEKLKAAKGVTRLKIEQCTPRNRIYTKKTVAKDAHQQKRSRRGGETVRDQEGLGNQ